MRRSIGTTQVRGTVRYVNQYARGKAWLGAIDARGHIFRVPLATPHAVDFDPGVQTCPPEWLVLGEGARRLQVRNIQHDCAAQTRLPVFRQAGSPQNDQLLVSLEVFEMFVQQSTADRS